jgi:glutaredoxin
MTLFEIYGRPGCHLCDEAETRVRQLVEGSSATVAVVNIELDDALHARYLERIPVVFADGRQIGELVDYRRETFVESVRASLSN